MKLRKGTILYHGTSTPDRFELSEDDYQTPRGPAWFSEAYAVAEYFMSWGAGPKPWVLTYRVARAPNVFKWNDRTLDRWARDQGFESLADMDVMNTADMVCYHDYDGWIIPDNYQDGSDIMICYPEEFLEFVRVEFVK